MTTTADDRRVLREWRDTHEDIRPARDGQVCIHVLWVDGRYAGTCGRSAQWVVNYGLRVPALGPGDLVMGRRGLCRGDVRGDVRRVRADRQERQVIERIDTLRAGKKSHHYKIDGKRAIGVTTALNGIPKGALVPWAARRVAEFAVDNYDLFGRMLDAAGRGPTVKFLTDIPPQERDDAADRGTEIHALAEKYAHGDEVEVPDELLPYVRGFAQYIDDFNPTTLHTELTVASRTYGYAGTLDCIEDVPGYGRCLVDWKTGGGIYGEYVLQCAAYRYAELFLDDDGHEQEMLPVDRVFILHIQPGDYDLISVQADEVAHVKFLVALENYRENVQSDKLKKLIGESVKPITWEAA